MTLRALILAALCALPSCGTVRIPQDPADQLAPDEQAAEPAAPSSGYVAFGGRVGGAAADVPTGTPFELEYSGITAGGNLEVGYAPADSVIEIGVRVGASFVDVDSDDTRPTSTAEAQQFHGLVLARLTPPPTREVRPFLEAGVGAHVSAVELSAPGLGTLYDDTETGLYWTAGAGIGVRIDDRSEIRFAVAYEQSEFADIDTDLQAVVGQVQFVSRF